MWYPGCTHTSAKLRVCISTMHSKITVGTRPKTYGSNSYGGKTYGRGSVYFCRHMNCAVCTKLHGKMSKIITPTPL